jgi:aromatic-L-amino-acid decarboxylase
VYPLEPDGNEMRRLVDEAMRRIVSHIESLPEQPAQNVEGATEEARTLVEPLPERGEAYESLLAKLFDEYIPRSFNAAGPGYLAYIPGGGVFHAAVADLIADSVNRYVGVCAAAPLLAQLEANVVRWFCHIIGLPRGSGGVLTSGGSLANFTAIATARDHFLGGADALVRPRGDSRADARPGGRGRPSLQECTLYCSDQVHHAFQKAAHLAGFPYANIREIETDDRFRMRIDALEEQIARDRAGGWRPLLVAGSAGTTNTGAVDDLRELSRVAKANAMWFHIDGAYGAFFNLTSRGREALRGIDLADSIILDPHKTLFLPFGTGAVLVRDAQALRRAHSLHADYLPAMQTEDELVDFCEISPELSRDFRGLRVWLPVKTFGIGVFREQLDEKLDLIEFITDAIRSIDGIEIVAEPQLTICAFRFRNDDSLTRRLLECINARKRVMLTGAIVRGQFVIRICIVSHRTHRDRVQMAIDDIRAAVGELAGEPA